MIAGRRASVRLTTISKLLRPPSMLGSLSGFSDRYGHNRGSTGRMLRYVHLSTT